MLADDYVFVIGKLKRQRDELDKMIDFLENLAPEQSCFVDLSRAPIMAALLSEKHGQHHANT